MIKKIKPVILFLLNLLFLQSAFGQVQINIPDYISQRFQSYCISVPREEIFIHTDREEYISGEDMWFNIYLIDRQSFKPSSNSKIVYFELLNPDNRPVLQKRLLIDKGFGPGQVVLPDTLSSGTYTIRAYTNWMKNFLPYNCFLKDIKVYNALRTKTFSRVERSLDIKETANDSLPVNSGPTIKVNNLKPDSLEILVHTDEKFRSENKNLIYLFIQTRGTINHISSEKITEEITKISILKKSLPPGINQITIFDSKGPVSDRFIYTPFKEKQVLALHSIDSCKQRNKVTLEIEIGNESSQISDLTNLSISVSPETNSLEIIDLNDYMVPGTEFGLFFESKIKGRKISELPPEVIDSLLLTVKSNWINWEKIFSNEKQLFRYPVEKEDHFFSGRLFTSNLQPAGADEILLMSTPGKEAVFQYTRTDKDGNFNFRVDIDEELKDLIIQPDIYSKNHKVYIESSFSDQHLQNEIFIDSTNKLVPSFISMQRFNYWVRKIYGSSSIGDRLTPVIPPQKSKRFYGTPDFELIMRDFIKLDLMQEVFFELVPHVSLEKNYSLYEISIDDFFHNKLEGAPGIMIDGVIIKDLSIIANLDPDLVEKIDVVWEKYRVGNYLFNGIINIFSKKGDFNIVPMPVDAIRLHYRVIDTVSSFVSPDYSVAEMNSSPVADFRNTLYWNPSVKPDKDGKARIEFWTADVKADYIININGITPEGKTVSLRKKIKVK